jgi:hypothetical protein
MLYKIRDEIDGLLILHHILKRTNLHLLSQSRLHPPFNLVSLAFHSPTTNPQVFNECESIIGSSINFFSLYSPF